jgi:uncharacterized protein YrzB (UPF0473 family)
VKHGVCNKLFSYDVSYVIVFDDPEQENETGVAEVIATSSQEAEALLTERIAAKNVGWRSIVVNAPLVGDAV